MSANVECPYCEEYVKIGTDEHYEGYEIYTCPKCDKNFEVYAESSVHYSTYGKSDCLNGSKHKWKPQIGIPKIYFRGSYVCETCSATKKVKEELATQDEWNQYMKDTLNFKKDAI